MMHDGPWNVLEAYDHLEKNKFETNKNNIPFLYRI
jgi:hypothetical protein